ncbi:MAG TPA: alanine racemase [Anaeromyxobacter sp.]|nr:alanine racemase [Anaeromyxobacter sp.]
MSTNPSQWGGRPVWAEVDLDAVAHNVRLLAARAAPARLYAVVKANAYGHGAVAVGRAALAAGASALCVVCVDEAEELRRAGVDAPILVIGYTPPTDADRVVALGVRPTVGSADVAEALAAAAQRRGGVVPVHLELESGLNRHGLAPDALVALATRLRAIPQLAVEGLFTHFAAAEEGDQRFTRRQFEVLREVSAKVPWIPERHCSASASVLLDHEMALEVVRTGLSMYGYRPAPWCGTDADLRQVLSLRSRVARVLEVDRGATVGYGRTWAATRPSRIALLMCGYADGYRRSLGNRAHVLVRGRRAPVVGRVAMDMCMVDVTAVPEVRAGDVATLIGRDGEERVDADELASLADTISWEILAGITARVPRLYLRDGRVDSASTLAERAPQARDR